MSYAQPMAEGNVLPQPRCSLRRAIAASAMGNATEWFDYGIYSYGLTYVSAALFPGSTAQATLFALATQRGRFLPPLVLTAKSETWETVCFAAKSRISRR